MIQFDKKSIGNLDMSSTIIHCKLVKNYKKNINFQHNFNTTSTQIQGVLFNQCIKLLYNHASFYHIILKISFYYYYAKKNNLREKKTTHVKKKRKIIILNYCNKTIEVNLSCRNKTLF